MEIYLSVVIPCYNEEPNIRLGVLDKVANYLIMQKYAWEVLVVDDGSDDQSVELIRTFIRQMPRFKLITRPHQGKASTVIAGMRQAKGKYILFTDLDQATPIDQVEKLLPEIKTGVDIVIGSRNRRRSGAPFLRRLMGPGFILVRNLILGLGDIEDTQCGFKLFKREVADDIVDRLVLYNKPQSISGSRVTAGFDVEILFVAKKLSYQIKEVPVEWHYVDTRRVSPIFDSIDALWGIIQIRLNSLQGKYNHKDKIGL